MKVHSRRHVALFQEISNRRNTGTIVIGVLVDVILHITSEVYLPNRLHSCSAKDIEIGTFPL